MPALSPRDLMPAIEVFEHRIGLTVNIRRITRYAIVTGSLIFLVIGGTRAFFSAIALPKYDKDRVVASMQLLREPQTALVCRATAAGRPGFDPAKSQLEVIRESKVLRIGYLNDSLPYAYFNATGEIVGFDVEMAYALARELGRAARVRPGGARS